MRVQTHRRPAGVRPLPCLLASAWSNRASLAVVLFEVSDLRGFRSHLRYIKRIRNGLAQARGWLRREWRLARLRAQRATDFGLTASNEYCSSLCVSLEDLRRCKQLMKVVWDDCAMQPVRAA